MTHARARLAALASTAALLAACGQSVGPDDPLIGTWRSDPFTEAYPAPPSMATSVTEVTFAANGTMSFVTTRRYPVTPGEPYSGCTWIDRTTGWIWLRLDASADSIDLGPLPAGGAQLSVERSGCTDAAQDHAADVYSDPTTPPLGATGASITGDRLTLTGPLRSAEPMLYTRER